MKTGTEIIPYNSKRKLYPLPHGMNRPITSFHVNELVTSIKLYGNIRKVVCIEVDFLEDEKRTYIVDGQHLREALNKCEQPIEVVYIGNITTVKQVIDLVAKLNNTSKPWSLLDYVNAWSNCPDTRAHYKAIQKYKEKYRLGYSTIAMLCNPYTMNKGTRSLKDGSIKVIDKALTEQLLANMDDVFTLVDKGYAMEVRVLVEGYVGFYLQQQKKGYNHAKFMNLLRQHKSHINQYMHNVSACVEFLNEVYKGGKVDRVAILTRAGSPKGEPKSNKVSRKSKTVVSKA